MVAIAFVPVLLLVARLAIDDRHATLRTARESAMRLIDSAVVEQRDLVRGAREVIATLAHLPEVAEGSPAECNRTLRQLLRAFPHYTAATRIGRDLRMDCSAVPFADSLADVRNVPSMVLATQTGEPVIGFYRVGRDGSPLATVLEPIRDSLGTLRFYLAVEVEMPWFERAGRAIPPGRGSMIAIAEATGYLFARYPDPEGYAGRAQPINETFRRMVAQRTGFVEGPGLDERHRLYAFRTLDAANPTAVLLVIGIPTRVLYAEANRHLRDNLLVAVVTLVLAMMMAWIAADLFVVRDVRRLLGATDRLAEGDLSVRLPQPAGGGELQDLATHFNHLARRLEERRREFLMLGNATPDAIVRLDRNLDIEWANTTVLRYLDIALDDLVGCNAAEIPLSLPVVPRLLEHVREALRSGRPQEAEEYVSSPGGDSWIDVRVLPERNAAGEVAGVILIARDVTARKHLEIHLMQSERLESIGKLAGSIAHDFNNLLTAIIGNADLALRSLETDHPVRGDLSEILDVSRRAASLTRQLLSFARRQPTAPRVIDANALIEETSTLVKRLIGVNIALDLRLDPAAPPVRFDPTHLEQVLINLATNARDAMPKGGTLTISTARRNPDEPCPITGKEDAGQCLVLTVSDTGVGMPPAVRRRIFEPFFTTKHDQDGTGLGLAMTYGMVRQHGGHIEVDSAEGRGATFRIFIPATHERPEPTRAPEVARPAPMGRETILVVEDQEQVRTMIARVLRSHGYRVIEARDGVDALSLHEEGRLPRLNLVITDLVMPRMGGEELVAGLRSRLPATLVLLISGFDERGSANDMIERGEAAALLEKPFEAELLLEKVRELLDLPERAIV
jgi:PAS domain S-box-containing protein